MDWTKFGIIFFLTTILPVWIIRLMDISFKMKVLFTLGGALGCYLAITRGSLKGFAARRYSR